MAGETRARTERDAARAKRSRSRRTTALSTIAPVVEVPTVVDGQEHAGGLSLPAEQLEAARKRLRKTIPPPDMAVAPRAEPARTALSAVDLDAARSRLRRRIPPR